jgi:hypothetical protein
MQDNADDVDMLPEKGIIKEVSMMPRHMRCWEQQSAHECAQTPWLLPCCLGLSACAFSHRKCLCERDSSFKEIQDLGLRTPPVMSITTARNVLSLQGTLRYLPGPQQRKVVLDKRIIGLGLAGEEVME